MDKKIFICVVIFLFLIQGAFAAKEFSVGVSPPLINVGDIKPGDSKPVSFYIVTSSDETLLVYMEPTPPLIDFFNNPSYSSNLVNYSEEPTVNWVQTFSNPVELKPTGEVSTFGGSIKGWREVNFLLNIPNDAEPGYHLIKILPKPSLPTSTMGQVGVQISAITPVTLFFNVPGQAIRNGQILDITTGRYLGNRLELNVYFLNTGTVTISAGADSIEVLDSNGKSVAKLQSDTKKIKPGEKGVLTTLLPLDTLSEGEFDVIAHVNYLTGGTQKSSVIKVYPQLALVQPQIVAAPVAIPSWTLILIAIIVILFIGIVIYRNTHEG